MKFGFALALATAANAASDWTSRPGLPDFARGFQSPSRYVDNHMDHDDHHDHHDDHHDDHHYSPSGFGSGKWNSYGSSSRSKSSYRKEEPKQHSYNHSYGYKKEEPKQHSYNMKATQEARPLYNQPMYNYDADRYNGYSQHQAPKTEYKPSHQHSYQAPKPTYQAPKPAYQAPKQYMGYPVDQRQNSYQAATGQQNMGIQSQSGHGYAAPQQHGYQAPQQHHAPQHEPYGHHQSHDAKHDSGFMFYNQLDQLERELMRH